MNSGQYDIAVVGSGFAGSLMASIARRLGRSVILLEQGKHPRFAIGESSTPLANLLLESISTRYGLTELTPLSKWGTWQKAHPEVACGLKRGFTFYHHTLGEAANEPADRSRQLLVAASPHESISDTHWYRADFDHLFLREALKQGVEFVDEVRLEGARETDDSVEISGTKNNLEFTVGARLVIDASGPRGFLHRALGMGELPLPVPQTQALYSHFSGVRRGENPSGECPPYPVDDAAVHHVFDGGWVWLLHFNNGITSAGVAATKAVSDRLQLQDGAEAWRRLLRLLPGLESQFAAATPVRPFRYVPTLSFRSGAITGRRWALLPSAAGFVDPLLSTGFTLTLLGVDRLARLIEKDWETDESAQRLQEYAMSTEAELLAAARLVGALYSSMNHFALFVAFSMLYFAAVSFSETAQRLGKQTEPSSFLLHDHPVFGPQCLRLFEEAKHARTERAYAQLCHSILKAIEPINVAGLGDCRRHNWYGVNAQDLFDNASKLGADKEEISAMLSRSGFWG